MWNVRHTSRSPRWTVVMLLMVLAALTLASVSVYLREWVRHMGAAP